MTSPQINPDTFSPEQLQGAVRAVQDAANMLELLADAHGKNETGPEARRNAAALIRSAIQIGATE